MNYWQRFSQDYHGKKVLIFGLGLQGGGVAVANTFIQAGAEVRVTDQKSAQQLQTSLEQLKPEAEVTLEQHHESDIDWADVIIKNAAVPYDHPLIIKALNADKPVLGEMALALTYIRDRSIAITGTRGKTTTTALIAHILSAAGLQIIMAGNIPGKPLLAQLAKANNDTWFVIEIPSFQIESFAYTKTSAHIGVITTIYPDHLNRYPTWEDYEKSKTNLFAYQQAGDIAIFQADREWSETVENRVNSEVQKILVTKQDILVTEKLETKLAGGHNQENIALASKVAEIFEIDQATVNKAIASFPGVAYRQENRGTINGLTFINDTTSTTPTALEAALDTYADKKFVLIAGGATKNLPLTKSFLTKVAKIPQQTVLLKGNGASELINEIHAQNLNWKPEVANSLAEAFELAVKVAQNQQAEMIVLSPGYLSFEMFNNEFDRGDQFNALVANYH